MKGAQRERESTRRVARASCQGVRRGTRRSTVLDLASTAAPPCILKQGGFARVCARPRSTRSDRADRPARPDRRKCPRGPATCGRARNAHGGHGTRNPAGVSRGRRSGRRRGPGRRRGDLPRTHRPGLGARRRPDPAPGEQLPPGRTGEVRRRQEGAGHDHDLRGQPGTTDGLDVRRTRLDRGRRDRPAPAHAGRSRARTERGVAPLHRQGGPAVDRALQSILRADSPAGRTGVTVTQR